MLVEKQDRNIFSDRFFTKLYFDGWLKLHNKSIVLEICDNYLLGNYEDLSLYLPERKKIRVCEIGFGINPYITNSNQLLGKSEKAKIKRNGEYSEKNFHP